MAGHMKAAPSRLSGDGSPSGKDAAKASSSDPISNRSGKSGSSYGLLLGVRGRVEVVPQALDLIWPEKAPTRVAGLPRRPQARSASLR